MATTPTAGDDSLIGTAAAETIDGLAGDDTIRGEGADDTLLGGLGRDWLVGGLGADILDGGSGVDQARYYAGLTGVLVDLSLDLGMFGEAEGDTFVDIENLFGTDHDDSLTGDAERNVLVGAAGDDSLSGLGGNDRLQGDTGADTIDGGAGVDTAIYARSDAGVTIDLDAGVFGGGHATGDSLTGIENVVGSQFADSLVGNEEENILTGNNGADHLEGMGGNDILVGGRGGDTMDGGEGYDFVDYSEATDNIAINTRNGQFLGLYAQGDILLNIEGVVGTNFGDSLILGEGRNHIIGGGGNDFLDGGERTDRLEGGEGADFLHGGDGWDRAIYRASSEGVNIAMVGAGVGGEAEGDILSSVENITGSLHDDSLTGNILDNSLIGLAGADVIIGDAGEDSLHGDGGSDTLTGGDDADIFGYRKLGALTVETFALTGTLAPYAGGTPDLITDFLSGTDHLLFGPAFTATRLEATDDIASLALTSATQTVFAFSGENLFYVFFEDGAQFAAGEVTVAHVATLSGATLEFGDLMLA